MEAKKNKRVIILAIAAVILCVIGICYYFFDFSSSSIAGSKKKKIPNGTVYAQYKNNEIPKDKIKNINNADKILAVLENGNMLISVDNAVKNYDPKTGKKHAVNYLNTGLNVEAVCSDGKTIAWIQEDAPKDNNMSSTVQCLYYCKVGEEKNELIDKSIVKVDKDNNAVSAVYSLLNFIKIDDNKIIYAAIDEKTLTTEYKSFDINTGAKNTLYVDSTINSDDKYKILFPMTFDTDLKKGYIVADINNFDAKDQTSTYSLTLFDLNKQTKSVLAKSSNEFSTSIDYPNIAFSLDKNIHVYNIEKNKDDFTIKCNGHAKNVDIKDSFVTWNENRIYEYSMNDDKTYMINNGWFNGSREDEGQKKINGNIIYWSDYGKLEYIEMGAK